MPELQLGDRARHVITGFEGIVTAKVSYLTGCDQVCLQPEGTTAEGKLRESYYFDAPYVDLVAGGVVKNRTPNRETGASTTPGRSGDASAPR